MGVVMDFSKLELTIDHDILPMKKAKSLLDFKALNNFNRDHLEPISTANETKCAVEIFDVKYEKANLAEIVSKNYSHLSTMQRNKLLRMLTKYEELFNRT